MKPVLVLQHQTQDHPATLAAWLRGEGVPVDVRNQERGDAYPDQLDDYRALALMGGEMSANDDLPALRHGERLILQAMARGLPVIGHCLGGQLMARALGATIGTSPAPEIGWQPIEVADDPLARAWFGDEARPTVFQWHYEAFSLPPGATALARSAACPMQAFAIGPHLGMQFHVEVDAEKHGRWSRSVDPLYLATQQRHPDTVQSASAMQETGTWALGRQQALADRLYRRWLAALG